MEVYPVIASNKVAANEMMKRSQPTSKYPSSGGTNGMLGLGKGSGSVEYTLLVGISCLLLTYAVITLRTFSSLSDADMHAGGDNGGYVRRGGAAASNFLYRAASARRDILHHPNPTIDGSRGKTAKIASQSDTTTSSDTLFPISIKSEPYETIIHPASEVAVHNHQNHKNEAKKMDVPAFWDPQKFAASGGVRQHLGQYGQRLITPQEASDVGYYVTLPHGTKLETIYVAIASYRDWQCTSTVENVFYRAKYPQRIRVAVVDQVDEDDAKCGVPTTPCDVDPNHILCKHAHQIDVYNMDATLAVGPVFARHIGHRMYRGEYFAMQADAHVKFTRHWDDDIISQWKSADNEMAVLTAYLSDIRGSIDEQTGERLHMSRPIMCRTDYEGWGDEKHLRHGQQPEGVPGIHDEPTLEPYWAAGFSFARGHFVVQVPYDQHLPMIFQGEEISIGLRGFTYGYDYYTPEKSVCFHMYAVGENKEKRKKVKLFWEHSNLYTGASNAAMARLLGIIQMSNPGVPSDRWIHDEEDKYGLGQVRTVQKFFDTYGIHTETQTVEQHLCRFVGKKMQKAFKHYLRKDRMGINYDEINFKFTDPAPNEKPPPLNGARG